MIHFTKKHLIHLSLLFAVLILSGCSSSPSLINATENNDTASVESLLSDGYDPNIEDLPEYSSRTPIYYAAQNCNNTILKKLIAAGGNVNKVSDDPWSPLIIAADYLCGTETIEILLNAGADINYRGYKNWNALLTSIYNDNAEETIVLLKHGADPSLRNSDGEDAYALSKKAKNISAEMIKNLHDAYLQEQKSDKLNKEIDAIEQRDKDLDNSLKHDKYLIAFSDALKSEHFNDAVIYATLLARLQTPMEDAFYYFWGESLLKNNQPTPAKEKLNEYIKKAGSEGKYYAQALRLIIQAENKERH